MRKTKFFLRWSIILLLIALLFFWAIWNAFLVDFVPWKRTIFLNEDSFFEMVKGGGYFAKELPSSAYNTKYYIGNRYFIRKTGYGTSVIENEYEQIKEDALQRYEYQYSMNSEISAQELYLYDEKEDVEWITEEYITNYDIKELEKLILKDEKISDSNFALE